jgi:RimJ/RimL family protein N-acetyltransferase
MKPAIETPRLLLRPWCDDDLDEFARLCADPAVMQYISGRPLMRDEVGTLSAGRLRQWREIGFGPWAAIDKASGCWIGEIGLNTLADWPDAHKVEVGWLLRQSWWGRGLATEGALAGLRFGFMEQKLERIISVTVPANVASRRVMEKAGLTYQGTRLWRGTEVVWYAIDRTMYEQVDVASV